MKVLFSTPCYGGMVTAAHFQSCINLTSVLQQMGLDHDWNIGVNESLIHRGRNAMARAFLDAPEFTHLWWLDADIEFTPDDAGRVWNLCEGEQQADIAVGVYAMKKRDEQWFAAWKDGALVKDLDQFDGPIQVDLAGTGFMLIKRSAVDKVLEHKRQFYRKAADVILRLNVTAEDGAILDTLLEGAAADYEANDGKRDPALYMTPIHNDGLESEDYHFCRMAIEAGCSLWMEPAVRLGHIGQYRYGA